MNARTEIREHGSWSGCGAGLYFALFIDEHPSSKVEGAKEFLGAL